MTNTNLNQTTKYRVDLIKVLICAALASAILIIMFHINNNQMAELIKDIQADKKESPNLIWFLEHITAAAPTFSAIIIMCIVYSDKERYVPVKTQREKLYVSIILACVTLIMFIYVATTDGEVKVGDNVESLLEKTVTWFAAQILPLSVLISYHAIRVGSEKIELEEAEANI